MKKRILPMIMAVTCMCSASPVFADYSFTDISEEQYAWCADQIDDMYKAGYINGYEDGSYRPDNEVTKLECISLFARAMGSNDAQNDEILELAHSQYDSALKSSSLVWGEDELAYMMYKGALNVADLTTYINGDAKDKPMTRGEAAVIITKAMGGVDKATSESAVSLHYKDARDIPTNILQYVKFVTDEGIMNGIDDEFCADGTVTRSQIAVMLKRVTDKCDYSFKKARINSVDVENSTIVYAINGENETEFTYDTDTDFYICGSKVAVDAIPDNVAAVIQFSGDEIVAIDAMSEEGDKEVTAIFTGYNASSTSMLIRVKLSEDATAVNTYPCDPNVPITVQGSPATIKSLKNGDTVVLSMSGGKVTAISTVEKTTEISSATISDISYDGETTYITISSSDETYDGKKYAVGDSVKVTKNGSDAQLSSLYVGDKISMTLKYGEVASIKATALNNTIEGVIMSITISEQSKIVIKTDGEEKTYVVPTDCDIDINGDDSDIYDLRVGDNITLTVQSGAIIKIKSVASITNTSGRVSGTVTAVNKSYNFVSVRTENSSEPINVFTNTKTNFVLQKGTSSSSGLNGIAVGDTVECYVTPSNGAYVADLIVITKAS